MHMLKVDAEGFDAIDRRLLSIIIEHFDGGPVGVESLAAALSEERGTIEDVLEPFLIQQGFLMRTARGRMATSKAYRHLGLKPPKRPVAEDLFDADRNRQRERSAIRRPSVLLAGRGSIGKTPTPAASSITRAICISSNARAREWLRGRGVDQMKLRETHGIVFVVSEMDLQFNAPARLDDELVATIESFTRRSASMLFTQCILRPADGARLIEARVRAACVDAATFKPTRIPDFLLHDLI